MEIRSSIVLFLFKRKLEILLNIFGLKKNIWLYFHAKNIYVYIYLECVEETNPSKHRKGEREIKMKSMVHKPSNMVEINPAIPLITLFTVTD